MLKTSAYNFAFSYDQTNKMLLFNSLSGAVLILDTTHYENVIHPILNAPDKNEQNSVVQELLRQRMLVTAETNELDILRDRYKRGQNRCQTLSLTFVPTLQCNFRCDYCFEPHRPTSLTNSHFNKILAAVRRQAPTIKSLNVTWFGGEPLLKAPEIDKWSQRLLAVVDDHGLRYKAGMVTNGYLLTTKNIELIRNSRISALQITIDGPKEAHDKRRPLHGGGSTYDMILGNLVSNREALEGIKITIRVNVDRRNLSELDILLSALREQGLNTWCSVYFARVDRPTAYCGKIDEHLFSSIDFAQKQIELIRILTKHGFEWRWKPEQKLVFCSAASKNHYVVDANGDTYHCWNDLGTPVLAEGQLAESDLENMPESRYQQFTPFNDSECRDCKFLPVCMGGCIHPRIKGKRVNMCPEIKYNIREQFGISYADKLCLDGTRA